MADFIAALLFALLFFTAIHSSDSSAEMAVMPDVAVLLLQIGPHACAQLQLHRGIGEVSQGLQIT